MASYTSPSSYSGLQVEIAPSHRALGVLYFFRVIDFRAVQLQASSKAGYLLFWILKCSEITLPCLYLNNTRARRQMRI